jgi:hypothetical protein
VSNSDFGALRDSPDANGAPLAILKNIGPLVASLGGSAKLAAALTVAAVAMGPLYECWPAILGRLDLKPPSTPE